jgi:primosomal protein N' (replication factor Y)
MMRACEESKSTDEATTRHREVTVRTAPDTFHQTIRSGLSHGAVLVQVAAKGYYNALFCRQCRNRPLCECGGRLRMVSKSAKSEALSCMLCSKSYESFRCAWCKSSQLTTLSKGSDRIAYELGKAFPKVQIAISNSGNVPDAIADGAIVIATPGCEPFRPNGYAAVVLLDCQMLLNRPILRSEEFARLHWRTALSQVQSHGQVFIDLPLNHREVQSIIRGNYRYSIENELMERSSLKLPPFVSIVRISGATRTVNQLYSSLTKEFPQLSIHQENQKKSEVERIIIRAPQNRLRELKRALLDMQKIRSVKKLEPLSIEVDPLDL